MFAVHSLARLAHVWGLDAGGPVTLYMHGAGSTSTSGVAVQRLLLLLQKLQEASATSAKPLSSATGSSLYVAQMSAGWLIRESHAAVAADPEVSVSLG